MHDGGAHCDEFSKERAEEEEDCFNVKLKKLFDSYMVTLYQRDMVKKNYPSGHDFEGCVLADLINKSVLLAATIQSLGIEAKEESRNFVGFEEKEECSKKTLGILWKL